MAIYRLKLEKKDSVYLYDGTLPGLYTCVHHGIYEKEMPLYIWSEQENQQSFFFTKTIKTHMEKAKKVRESLRKQLGQAGLHLIETVFYSCLEEKEKKIFIFIVAGYQMGKSLLEALDHPSIYPLYKAQRHLLGEVHLYTGFVRFEEVEGVLFSKIAPKNQVLPFLSSHFSNRFSKEQWLIYDETHKQALCYQKGEIQLIPMEKVEVTTTKEEKQWQNLWKTFYQTLSIKERENKKCRMNHMPKRYWSNMVEVKEEVGG